MLKYQKIKIVDIIFNTAGISQTLLLVNGEAIIGKLRRTK